MSSSISSSQFVLSNSNRLFVCYCHHPIVAKSMTIFTRFSHESWEPSNFFQIMGRNNIQQLMESSNTWQVSSNFVLNHVVNPVFYKPPILGGLMASLPIKMATHWGNSSHLTGGLSALATHCRTSCSAGVTLKASRNKAMASCGWCFGSSFFRTIKCCTPLNSTGNPNFYGILGVGIRWKMTFRLIMAMFWGSMIHFGGHRSNLSWGWSYFGWTSSHLLSLRPLQCPKPSLIAFSTWILSKNSQFTDHNSAAYSPMNSLNP